MDGDRILQETDGVTTLTYYYGANGVIGFHYNGTDYYYRKNLQGDVIAIYTAAGVLVAEYQYDAWGKILNVINHNGFNVGAINPFRYRSYYFDQETGLYYVSSRYYDPEIGRFINADGFISTGQEISGHNMFSFCGNNSVNGTDPSGCAWIPVLLAFVLIAVCVVAVSSCSNNKSGFITSDLVTSGGCPEKTTDSDTTSTTIPEVALTEEQKHLQLIVAQTIYGEERGRTVYPADWEDGQRAVATVILNRYNAQISYLGKDLETICTNGQFDGYNEGKKAYSSNTLDPIAWDSAMDLAECVVLGDYGGLCVPAGITTRHLYFNATGTYNKNVDRNNGFFSFGLGTKPVSPKGVVTYGGNTFFYY